MWKQTMYVYVVSNYIWNTLNIPTISSNIQRVFFNVKKTEKYKFYFLNLHLYNAFLAFDGFW
jgi:hypothetical protein